MSAAENKAVFLSYASQDAEEARRICESLRAAGVEVWFDQSELRGGDAWDAKIRKQIKECALFVPVISANTQARLEGYFRLEWKLAAQRTHTMADAKPFLVPIAIDDTRDADAHVPEEFRAVQWTRLVSGETSPKFCERMNMLLKSDAAGVADPGTKSASATPARAKRQSGRWWLVPALTALAAFGALAFWQPWKKTPSAEPKPAVVLTEARKLALQARALIDDDWLAVRENFRIAADLCERATKLDPTDGEAWATWARVSFETLRRKYDSSTQLREAGRSQAERAIRLAPKSIESRLAEAVGLALNGRKNDAVQRLRALIADAPMDPRIARALANAVDRAEATEIRLSHPAFAGRDPRPLADEAIALYNGRRFADTEKIVERILPLAPSYEVYDFHLAYLIYVIGDIPQAKLLLEKLPAQLLQEDVFAGFAATVWLWLGEGDKALAVLRRVPRDYLEDSWYVSPKGLLAGRALRMSGRAAAAEAEWKQALIVVEKRLATQPNDPKALMAKATLLALGGQKMEAEKTWALAAELGEFSKANRANSRARIHVAFGENEEAIRELQAGLLPVTNGDAIAKVNMVRFEPEFEPIRNDPRIQQIIAAGDVRIRELREKTPPPANVPPAKSVAVLPFANHSAEKDSEYFSDGLTEEILSALARERDLRVPGRASAFSFKGKTASNPEIAHALNVAQLVEGSVRRSGTTVRISIQLWRSSDGFVDALPSFQRELTGTTDIFALQDEVARAVVQKLTGRTTTVASAVPTQNLQAYEAYLRGREFAAQTSPSWPNGAEAFQRAVELDPKFALAWANLGQLAARLFFQGFAAPATAKQAVDEAIRLEPDLPEAHLARAVFLRMNHAPVGEVERALATAEKNKPNDPDVIALRASIEGSRGQFETAVKLWQRVVELDPRNGAYVNALGNELKAGGRYAEAEVAYQQAFQILGSSIPLTNRGANYFLWKGDLALVTRTLDEASDEIRGEAYWGVRASVLYSLGDYLGALGAEAQLKERSEKGFKNRVHLRAQVLDSMGDAVSAHREYLVALPVAEKQRDEFPELPRAHEILALIYGGLGRKEDALAAARKSLELVRPADYAEEAAGSILLGGYRVLAQTQARFGMLDEALAIVQAQASGGWWRRKYLLLSPDWATLRKDPRFRAIAEKAPL